MTTKDNHPLTPLTDEEHERLEGLVTLSRMLPHPEVGELAIVRSMLDGEQPVALVSVVKQEEEDGPFIITPLAVLVDHALFQRLSNPNNEGIE